MIKPRGSPNKPATIIELPTTPLTPAQAESQRILSNMPDPDPIHGINYEWSMKDLQNWSKAEQEFRAKAAYGPNLKIKKPSKGPMTFGGRVWWSAAARLSSILILLIGIIAESLIILRDASARITELPYDDSDIADATKEKRFRFARDLVYVVLAPRGNALTEDGQRLEDAPLTHPLCQWVQNTDVQNNGSGIPLAVTYHLFTTLVLALLILAEFKIWSYRLHPSSALNIGVIQLWTGLAGLSRSVNNTFVTAASGALVVAGVGNVLSGFCDRWRSGGPGFMFFGTGIAPAQYSSQNGAPPGEVVVSAKPQKNLKGPSPPNPLQELLESEKLAGLLPVGYEEAPQPIRQSPRSTAPAPLEKAFSYPYQQYNPHYLGPTDVLRPNTVGSKDPAPGDTFEYYAKAPGSQVDPNAHGLGGDEKSMLDYLAYSNPAAYMEFCRELHRREHEEKRSRTTIPEKDKEETSPLRVHFSDRVTHVI